MKGLYSKVIIDGVPYELTTKRDLGESTVTCSRRHSATLVAFFDTMQGTIEAYTTDFLK